MKESIFNYFDSIKTNDHIAHVCSMASVRYEIGARFIADGLRNDQRCVLLSENGFSPDLLSRVQLYKIDVEKYKKNNRLKHVNFNSEYKSKTNPEELVSFIEKILGGGKKNKTTRLIISREFTPLQYNQKNNLSLEANLSQLTLNSNVTTLNQFDVDRLNARQLLNIFKTHPVIIENENVYRSPFYTDPDNIIQKIDNETNCFDRLTQQEIIVLTGIVNGKSNRDIAENLSISVRTVETHRYNIMKKTGTGSIVELIKLAIKNGLF